HAPVPLFRKINHARVKSILVRRSDRARAGVSMSNRPLPHSHEYGHGRTHAQRQRPRATGRADWTLGHGGRQVRVRPVAFWIIVGSLVIMAGWSAVTATYFAFRDDVLTR